jgi:hypothetical protein
MEKFCLSLKAKGYNLNSLEPKALNDVEVGIFHDYLMKLNTGKSSYNKHFRICKAFFNWLIEKKKYKIPTMRQHNGIRPQDIVILLKIIALDERKEANWQLNRRKMANLIDYNKRRVKVAFKTKKHHGL